MTLDELIFNIKNISGDNTALAGLTSYLDDWKNNDKTVADLGHSLEKFCDYFCWHEEERLAIYTGKIIYDFQTEAISNIGGMTMNERLYYFCLLDRFDSCKNDAEKDIIYEKLLGSRLGNSRNLRYRT